MSKRIPRFLTVTIITLLLVSGLVSQVYAAYIIANEVAPNTSGVYVPLGQSFTTLGAGQIVQIDAYMGAMNGRTTDLRIYSGGQQPNNPTTALYVQTGIAVNCNSCWFSIPVTPLDVNGAAVYTIEFTNMQWRFNSTNPYSGGTAWQNNTSVTTVDFGFRVHITEGPSEDWGDLPDPSYPTLLANDGPRHTIVAGAPYLGSIAPDAESDGQPTANADGDDTNGADDEDGVTRAAGLGSGTGGWTNGTVTDGQGGAVDVTILYADGTCLGAFFDFDGSGTLSAVTLRDTNGVEVSQPLAGGGADTFYFDVPAGTFPGGGPDVPVYSRFRVTSPVGGVCTGSPAYSSTGSAPDGEVEDYVWTFTTNAVVVRGFGAAGSGLWGMGLVITLAAGVVVIRRKKSQIMIHES